METTPAPSPQPATPRPLPPPARQDIHWRRALLWHGLGFLTIIVLTWSYELFDIAHRIFGGAQRDLNLTEGLSKSGVILLLWGVSAYQVYRIVSRLSYLENFLQICAWCRKINVDNDWKSLEKHFTQQTGKRVSHGMCPECARKFQAGLSLDQE